MSLNRAEQAATSEELVRNLEISELTHEQVAADLAWSAAQLRATLAVGGGDDPVAVWQLRDYLEQVLADQGRTGVAFSILTESSRVKARRWFALRAAPHHVF